MVAKRASVLLGLLLLAAAAWAGKPNKRESDEERGRTLYDRHCLACHGASAAGDGPASAALVGGVPDVRELLTAARREANAKVVLNGRRTMPGFELSFALDDARRVIREMERRATPAVSPP
jgi:mono/diheme cytochrome c family protein